MPGSSDQCFGYFRYVWDNPENERLLWWFCVFGLVWGCPRLQVGCLFSVSSNQIWICFQKSCHGYPTHTCLAGLMLCVRVSRVQGACLFLIDPRLSQWMKFKFYLTFPAKYSVSHVNMSRNRSPSISNPGLRLQIDLSWKRKSCSLM